MTATTLNQLRLVGVAGANKVMAGEVSRLARRAFDDWRMAPAPKEGSSLVYPFEPRLAGLLLRYHRTGARLLWDLYASDAIRLEPLYQDLLDAVAQEPEHAWRSGTVSVYAQRVEDFPAGERQVVGTVKNALVDGLARRGVSLTVDPDHFDTCVSVRGYEGKLVVSRDLAGRPLHERGYRLQPGGAPLREDLAALVVMLSRFDARSQALIDPMAGSGTIAIEAMGLAAASPTWHATRSPLATSLELLDASIRDRGALFADTEAAVFANERDPEVFRCLQGNVQTAGVEPRLSQVDFRELDPNELRRWARDLGKSSGVIVCNPPYGERTPERGSELERLYRDFGHWCRQFRGWTAAILMANPAFLQAFGGKPRIVKPLSNGPIKGYFYLYDL